MNERLKCIIWMTLASSCHYVGYELARTASFALLTSKRHGFSNGWAVSLATACVSPCSMVLLWIYTRLYDAYGPRKTLWITCVAFAGLLLLAGTALSLVIPSSSSIMDDSDSPWRTWTRSLLFALFTIQNAMVYLLSTQHWSFLGSVVTSPTQTSWAAGVGSAFSTFGGMAGGSVTVDLTRLLMGAGVCLVASAWCGEKSYEIAENEGIASIRPAHLASHSSGSSMKDDTIHSLPLVPRARALFRRVRVLWWLCLEVFCYQCQSSLLNFLFVAAARESLSDDVHRAKHTATTYATINLCSGLLQFLVIPLLSSLGWDFEVLWVGVPCVMTGATVFMAYTQDWSLWLVSSSFVMMKTLEYSLRHSMIESVYTSLDQESRFVGKEIIAMCANRFGKSLVALVLTVVNLLFTGSLPYIRHSLLVLCMAWLVASYRLTVVLAKRRRHVQSKSKDD